MTTAHDRLMRDWEKDAARREGRNFRFLRSLKVIPNPDDVDALARELHGEAFGQIDCTRCANCCKTMRPGVSDEDVERISARLGLSGEAFREAYLAVNELGEYEMKTVPCPFLGADDRCTIYEVRPEACREFPHTDKEGFTSRVYAHAANTPTCPAVFYIVEELRDRRWLLRPHEGE
jgi:Fe-S-cluster containining protein